MSCKDGPCEYGKQTKNVCCALCDEKHGCRGFCTNLPSPDDCSSYVDCEDFILNQVESKEKK